MWDIICTVLLIIECMVLGWFIIGRIRKKKFNETALFVGIVCLLNLALYMVPYLHGLLALGNESNYLLDVLDCFMGSLQNFVGMFSTRDAAEFATHVPVFTYTFLLGVLLAMLGTVSAAVEAYQNQLRNALRLARKMKKPVCDVVFGDSEQALCYAKNSPNAVLLLDKKAEKATVSALEEQGFAVLQKAFGPELLHSKRFCPGIRYNLICLKQADTAECLNGFIAWKQEKESKDILLFLETDGDQEETIRREIIEKNGMEECITTFCAQELLARTFMQQHPVTEKLPADFVEADCAIRPEVNIHYCFLGFTPLSKEIYRQSVLNNQLVCFKDGTYELKPIEYTVFDRDADGAQWNISGLDRALSQMEANADAWFPLPERPYLTQVHPVQPQLHEMLEQAAALAAEKDSYCYYLIDTGDGYRNMDLSAKLQSLLADCENYHIFACSQADFVHDSEKLTYYGDPNQVFTREIIVDDGLSVMAKALNRVYTQQQMLDQKNRPDFAALVEQMAWESWNGLNYFSIYSNVYAAMNLRLKLNLLGLDYVADGKGENLQLIGEKYPRAESYTYADYQGRSKRNALLAQEHARWNAYHLLAEYLPMQKANISVKSNDGSAVKFNTKNTAAKRHACLTTFQGLDVLSAELAKKASALTGKPHTAADYDFYVYDEMLLCSAAELLGQLGYSVTEK